MTDKSAVNSKALKFVLLLAILAVCWYLGRVFDMDVADYQKFLSRFPLAVSGLAFVLLYVVTTTFVWFGPKDVLRIASAILFGAYISTVFVWAGEMANAAVMFHLSRILGREYVQQRFGVQSGDLEKMKDNSSFLGVLALRINPLIPFRLMDLGYGLSAIAFPKYFWAIVIVSFFRILWLQFILAGIGISLFEDVSATTDYLMANPSVIVYSGIYFCVVVVVSVIAFVMRIVRKRRQNSSNS